MARPWTIEFALTIKAPKPSMFMAPQVARALRRHAEWIESCYESGINEASTTPGRQGAEETDDYKITWKVKGYEDEATSE